MAINIETILNNGKKCSKCGLFKLLCEFDTNGKCRDGTTKYHSWCKSCLREHNHNWSNNNKQYFRDWAIINHSEVIKQHRTWRHNNPDKTKASKRKCYLKHQEQYCEYSRNYRKEHLEYYLNYNKIYQPFYCMTHKKERNAYCRYYRTTPKGRLVEFIVRAKRRAVKNSTRIGDDVDKSILEIKLAPIVTCHICGNTLSGKEAHIDHIIPLARGGSHTKENIAPAHAHCNIKKGASLPIELIRKQSDLKRTWVHK